MQLTKYGTKEAKWNRMVLMRPNGDLWNHIRSRAGPNEAA